MALILVNNKICNSCGIDIRPNALFCYSCGSAIASEEKVDDNLAEEKSVQIVSPEK
jgi:predicted amidophosphoribosyltransferase